jgi:2-C-methyl-D-erythritol 4-phosphate cytidylyltransferase
MNATTPKQFLLLKGKPVLYYSIQAFLDAYAECRIILVLPEEHVAAGQEIIDAFLITSAYPSPLVAAQDFIQCRMVCNWLRKIAWYSYMMA